MSLDHLSQPHRSIQRDRVRGVCIAISITHYPTPRHNCLHNPSQSAIPRTALCTSSATLHYTSPHFCTLHHPSPHFRTPGGKTERSDCALMDARRPIPHRPNLHLPPNLPVRETSKSHGSIPRLSLSDQSCHIVCHLLIQRFPYLSIVDI